jgi:hypothetical protein
MVKGKIKTTNVFAVFILLNVEQETEYNLTMLHRQLVNRYEYEMTYNLFLKIMKIAEEQGFVKLEKRGRNVYIIEKNMEEIKKFILFFEKYKFFII